MRCKLTSATRMFLNTGLPGRSVGMPMKAPNAKNIMITASGTDILGETWTIRSAMFCACNGNPSFSEEDRRQS